MDGAARAMDKKRTELRAYGLQGSKVLGAASTLGEESKPVISLQFDEDGLLAYRQSVV